MTGSLSKFVRLAVYASLAFAFGYLALLWANARVSDYYVHRTWNTKG